jgi:hypothetical protein
MRHCCRQVIIGPCPSYYTHTYIDLLWPWPDTYGHMQGNNIAIMSRSSCLGSLAVQNGRKRRSMFPDNTTSAPVSLHCASPRSTFPLPDSLTGTHYSISSGCNLWNSLGRPQEDAESAFTDHRPLHNHLSLRVPRARNL